MNENKRLPKNFKFHPNVIKILSEQPNQTKFLESLVYSSKYVRLSEPECIDVYDGLAISMKLLNEGNTADQRLSDRLGIISKRIL